MKWMRAIRAVGVVMVLSGANGVRGQESPEFAPTSGEGQVIAQGVAALPADAVVWRVVRGRTESSAEAAFVARPLGFLLATGAPIIIVDGKTGEQARLGRGEAALVPAGSAQRWASAGEERGSYLAISLAPADSAPEGGTPLLEGAPFQPATGPHDVDLVRGVLEGDETYELPATEQEGVILATDGTIAVSVPGGEPTTLLAGEGATFVGELVVAAAGSNAAVFVAAVIGPEVEPVAVAPPTVEAAPPPTAAAEVDGTEVEATEEPGATRVADDGQGSITIEVFACPPGMGPETLAVAVCAPEDGDFDVTLSGEGLDAPLTLADAEAVGDAFVWSGLAPGRYRIAEAVLPSDAETYLVSAANAAGDPESGYVVDLSDDEAGMRIRIYNFADVPESEASPEAG